MRNFKNLGKVLSKSQQKNILGGNEPRVFRYEGDDCYKIPHHNGSNWGTLTVCD